MLQYVISVLTLLKVYKALYNPFLTHLHDPCCLIYMCFPAECWLRKANHVWVLSCNKTITTLIYRSSLKHLHKTYNMEKKSMPGWSCHAHSCTAKIRLSLFVDWNQQHFFQHPGICWVTILTLPCEGCSYLTNMTSSLPCGCPSSTNSSDRVLRGPVAEGRIKLNEMWQLKEKMGAADRAKTRTEGPLYIVPLNCHCCIYDIYL